MNKKAIISHLIILFMLFFAPIVCAQLRPESTLTRITGSLVPFPGCCNLTQILELLGTLTQEVQDINLDFNGTFSFLSEINDTLTSCCENIQVDFNGVFTALNSLASSPCAATPITAATTISTPGYYCVANDIVGTIAIQASDVTLDLNNHTISATSLPGISINTGISNVKVMNGRINGTSIGVQLIGNTSEVLLERLIITNCSDTGIEVGSSSVTTLMNAITIDSVTNHGINFVGNNTNSRCVHITIVHCSGSFGIGLSSGTMSDSLFQDCHVLNSTFGAVISGAAYGFLIGGNSNQFVSCSVQTITLGTSGNLVGFSVPDDALMENCTVQHLTAFVPNADVIGFNGTGNTFVLQNCTVIDMQSNGTAQGFLFNSSSIGTLTNCIAQKITGNNGATGFSITSGSTGVCNVMNCLAYGIGGDGFLVSNSAQGTMTNCEGSYNTGNGFDIGTTVTVLSHCIAVGNDLFGFNGTAGSAVYGCFASNNAGGNYNAIPNQSAATSTIAQGNTFL